MIEERSCEEAVMSPAKIAALIKKHGAIKAAKMISEIADSQRGSSFRRGVMTACGVA